MTEFELEILRELAGKREARPWGAAVGEATSFLRDSGYVDERGLPTERGLEALRQHPDPEEIRGEMDQCSTTDSSSE